MNDFSQRFSEIPSHLLVKVNGHSSEEAFLYVGKCIADAVEKEAGGFAELKDILDFGCGVGRVTTQLVQRAPTSHIIGFDIDPMMLTHASRLLGETQTRFVSTTLELPDESFDLIVIISVFTHLDATTDFWLAELHRLLRPAGKAFVTYHDETLFAEMADKNQFPNILPGTALKNRHVVGEGSAEGGAAMGTFYTTAYWNDLLGRFFNLHTTLPRGLFGHQSYSIVSKRNAVIDRCGLYRQYALSLERDLFSLRKVQNLLY